MRKQRITSKTIHDASAILIREMMADEKTYTEPMDLSQEFQNRMEELLRGRKVKEYKVHHIRRRFWMTAAMIALVLFTWLAVDTKTRAAVAEWFKSVIEDVFHYSFSGSAVDEDLPEYRLGWLPKGGKVEEKEDSQVGKYSVDVTYEDGGCFSLIYGKFDEGIAFNIDSLGHEIKHQIIKIRDQEIEEYYTPHWDDYNYVWINKTENIYFSVWSTLDHETNVKIIEDLLRR